MSGGLSQTVGGRNADAFRASGADAFPGDAGQQQGLAQRFRSYWHSTAPEQRGIFARAATLSSAAIVLTWILWNIADQAYVRKEIRNRVDLITQEQERIVERWIVNTAQQSLITAANPALRNYQANLSQASDILFLLISEVPSLRQVRLLNLNGHEVMRYNRSGNQITPAPEAQLQNKSQRYYFEEGAKLDDHGLYISPLDLNIEFHQVVRPLEPTIRMVAPVLAPGGERAGLLVLNVDPNSILQLFGRRFNQDIDYGLLNAEGVWLAGGDPEWRWSSMLDGAVKLKNQNPELWRKIQASRDGSIDLNGYHYAFHVFQLNHFLNGKLNPLTQVKGPTFIVLGSAEFRNPFINPRASDLIYLSAAIIVALVLSWQWSRMVVERHQAEAARLAAQEHLSEVQKIASLGGLVAGVAHELNTPIGNAVSIASAIAHEVDNFESNIQSGDVHHTALKAFLKNMREGTVIMLRGLERAADLIGHFKQTAVDQTGESRREFNLSDIIEDVVASIRPKFKTTQIAIRLELLPSLRMESFPGPLGQVLLNLLDNARQHAFHEKTEGAIHIRSYARAPDTVTIDIVDDGDGMPVEVQRSIFDPFFTTQRGNGGSGLGLSIVFNIVTGVLGGKISVKSELNQGSCFSITLPRVAPLHAELDKAEIYRRSYGP